MVNADNALPGRPNPLIVPDKHFVNGHSLQAPYPAGFESIVVGMGCFWGAERCFWQCEGVYVTAVGYAGGFTENPLYEEVCSGATGHTEVVLVVYDPTVVDLNKLLNVFWQGHDPTQGMRQGNDRGTQYRSAIYTTSDSDLQQAIASKDRYQGALDESGFPAITTEISSLDQFHFAEGYHQQYLAKNPGGYCGLGGTGVSCPG